MTQVSVIIDRLRKVVAWEDGEDISAIIARLTAEQLDAPGTLRLRVTQRGNLPGLVCCRVEQEGVPLFEVKQRLPPHLTRSEMDHLIEEWRAAGFIEMRR